MNLFKVLLSIQGIPLKKAILEKQTTLEGLENETDEHEKAKWASFKFHQQHNPFYKDFLTKAPKPITQWCHIPILEKSDIQRPLPELLTTGISLKDCYKNNTSGSTGKPFYFAKDKYCHAMTWAFIFDSYRKMGLEYGKSLQARFFGIPRSVTGFAKEKVKDFFAARRRFSVFDLSEKKLNIYLQRFHKIRFEYIYGYTSSLVLFAEFVINRNIVLKQVCPSLKWCIVTSEVCSLEDRNTLEKGFGIPVRNEYGAAELDIIAFEDHDGDWILNDENLVIEVIGSDGCPVNDGEEGSAVVTSLYNRAMPFIRYNLGDIISVSPERKGRLRKIKSMQGRINDVAVLPSGKRSPGLTFYYISKGLLAKGGFLKEFTIKQMAIDHFHFEYIADDYLTPGQKLQVQKMMDIYLEPGLKATFERKDKIERTGAGKFKHFHNLTSSVGS